MTEISRLPRTVPRLLLLLALCSPAASLAEAYAVAGMAIARIRTDTGATSPLLADLRLGYRFDRFNLDNHKLELALMPGLRDDNLNQLVTDIPLSTSLFYRYNVTPHYSIHTDLILGYSRTDVTSSYVNVPEFTDSFHGISFGVGFEESLKSIPQLAFKVDIMQLYRGSQLRINTLTLGFRYAF